VFGLELAAPRRFDHERAERATPPAQRYEQERGACSGQLGMFEAHPARRRRIGIVGGDGASCGCMTGIGGRREEQAAGAALVEPDGRPPGAEQRVGVGGQRLQGGFEAQAGRNTAGECDREVSKALMEGRFEPEAAELSVG
jgi:hypothetical protein